MIQLDDIVTNRRERNISQSFNKFGEDVSHIDVVPGHYYMLDYIIPNLNETMLPSTPEAFKEDPSMFITNKEFVDMNPAGIVFHHEKWKENILMLNLKVIPPKYRAALIMAHINIIKESLDRINAFSDDIMSFRDRQKIGLSLYAITPKILEDVSGIKIGYAMGAYNIDKIQRAKLLDWNNIGELPLANVDTHGIVLSSGVLDINTIFNNFENKQLR